MVDNFAYVTNTMFFFEQRNLYLIPVRGRGKSEAADRNRFHRFTRPNRKFKFVSSSHCEFYRILPGREEIIPSSSNCAFFLLHLPKNSFHVKRNARGQMAFELLRTVKYGILVQTSAKERRFIRVSNVYTTLHPSIVNFDQGFQGISLRINRSSI